MKPFTVVRPGEAAQAVALGSADGAAFLAGGTTMVDLLKLGVVTPDRVVDISALPLARIEPTPDGGLRIGALARNSAVAAHAAIVARYPVLREAVLGGASPQLRNMATVGGNLLQRTRCPYFRDGLSACNQRVAGSGCAAIGGVNRMHAVLGTSERCMATYPGDMAVALVALDATVRTLRADGSTRALPVADLHVSFGDDPEHPTVLERGELITAVDLPATTWSQRSAYARIRARASYDFALASTAVALDVVDGRVRDARVVLGGVATKPWRAPEAEACLIGSTLDDETVRAAGRAAVAQARPVADNAFKVQLVRRTLMRAVRSAAGACP
jgi:xanthine dehydrogenase YagS FAD-binding subunit